MGMKRADYVRITDGLRQTIVNAVHEKSVPHAKIAEAVGVGKPWVSKLLTGKLETIHLDHLEIVQDVLGVQLMVKRQEGEPRSALAEQMAALVEQNPAVASIAQAVAELVESQRVVRGIGWIETKDMTRIGQEIIRICFADEDKPGKVAKLVLKLLSKETV